jgi:hypothetical protein
MLTAYAPQIIKLANAILAAPEMKMDQAAVDEWRDLNFQPLTVGLKRRDQMSGLQTATR